MLHEEGRREGRARRREEEGRTGRAKRLDKL